MASYTDSLEIVILAAGKGTRMKSDTAKVLHTICNRPMIQYVVETAVQVADSKVVVVVGHQAEAVKKTVLEVADVKFAMQIQQKGTGHAVICAMPMLTSTCIDVVILSGDVPLICPETIQQLIECHRSVGNDITVLAVKLNKPHGYGRIVQNQTGEFERIVEEVDATPEEKRIDIINSGIYCVKRCCLEASLSQIKADNAQKEIYLTDIVKIARDSKKKVGLMIGADPNEIMGVNTVQDLQKVASMAGLSSSSVRPNSIKT
jgi:bifunctional UDP-N-acetylglucosamine pyrophosphorylase/glucosamine-1-phosphate N-acetyltransferase/UDP-N-acetylglucosamine pyrophosphorylase